MRYAEMLVLSASALIKIHAKLYQQTHLLLLLLEAVEALAERIHAQLGVRRH